MVIKLNIKSSVTFLEQAGQSLSLLAFSALSLASLSSSSLLFFSSVVSAPSAGPYAWTSSDTSSL